MESVVGGMLVKERQILMTPENAQKCHEGTKTQTRRIVKYNPILGEPSEWCCETEEPEFVRIVGDYRRFCPYGLAGDRLWVREAWQEKAWSSKELNQAGFLSAPKKPRETYLNQDLYAIHKGGYNRAIGDPGKWRSSIHMPRWACRTVLEITDVRVERLQEISDADALAEGVDVKPDAEIAARVAGPPETGARMEYFVLWESIHGKGSWELNPWVWVIEFRKVEEDVND